MALGFCGAGVLHVLRPALFVEVMPPWLPHPRLLVLVSGACEIAGGVGLLVPRVRRLAGWGLVALLVAVVPANIQMLRLARAEGATPLDTWLLVARLPMQLVLIWWVWWTTTSAPAREKRSSDA